MRSIVRLLHRWQTTASPVTLPKDLKGARPLATPRLGGPLDWFLWVTLLGLALAVRLPLSTSDPYGDEGAHYAIARGLGAVSDHIQQPPPLHLLFLGRPLFALVLWPAALISFKAFRILHIVLASALPSLASAVGRAHGAGRITATAAGLVIVFHPLFLVYAIRVFPDTLLALATLAGLLARRLDRPGLSSIFLVAAAWIKEPGLVAIAALAAVDLWRDARVGAVRLWPLRISLRATLWAITAAAAVLPLVLLLALGGRLPGWTAGGPTWARLDTVLLSSWMGLILALGLVRRSTRSAAALGLVFPLFYLAYRLVLGRNVEEWYGVLPASLALAAASVVVHDGLRVARPIRWWRPAATATLTAIVVAALVVLAVAPGTSHLRTYAAPLSKDIRPNLPDTWHGLDHARELQTALAQLQTRHEAKILLVDVGWYFIVYPFGDVGSSERYRYSDGTAWDRDGWTHDMEDKNTTVVLWVYEGGKVNGVLRDVYGDCAQYSNASFVLYDGADCQGHGERLRTGLAAIG